MYIERHVCAPLQLIGLTIQRLYYYLDQMHNPLRNIPLWTDAIRDVYDVQLDHYKDPSNRPHSRKLTLSASELVKWLKKNRERETYLLACARASYCRVTYTLNWSSHPLHLTTSKILSNPRVPWTNRSVVWRWGQVPARNLRWLLVDEIGES